jgi:hypothetical protein
MKNKSKEEVVIIHNFHFGEKVCNLVHIVYKREGVSLWVGVNRS